MLETGVVLPWNFSPIEALQRWPKTRRVAMLHSGRFDPRWSRWSLLASPVGSYRFLAKPGGVEESGAVMTGRSMWSGSPDLCPLPSFTDNPFVDLNDLVGKGDGIWVGLISYDLGRWVERLPMQADGDREWPIIELAYCPGYLTHDAATGAWSACGDWKRGGYPELMEEEPRTHRWSSPRVEGRFSGEEYESRVRRILGHIRSGDVYQVNLAQRFTAGFRCEDSGATRDVYRCLADISPAWYGAYLELSPFGDCSAGVGLNPVWPAIASISPELFLRVQGRHVMTRPIKGTRPEREPVQSLTGNEKEIAELNMIVDLLRNDLGRVCESGSIRVTEPRPIETHPPVPPGVATIEGYLHESKNLVDLLRATFPGGSVTGVPKVRAMQIIEELEGIRRGPYCGCIGVLSRDWACLNVAIRTMLIDPSEGRIDFSMGAGIVADSNPTAEYEETLVKANALIQALHARHDGPGRGGTQHGKLTGNAVAFSAR
jgi:para-aminobenzoate synthetase component 1